MGNMRQAQSRLVEYVGTDDNLGGLEGKSSKCFATKQ